MPERQEAPLEAAVLLEQELYQSEVGCMKVDLNNIEQNENSRVIYKSAELADLMHSMKKDGLLQPVGVRKIGSGKYEAVFGNRRIMAARKLGWADIAVHVVEAATDSDRDILNLVENIQRRNTTLAEDGRMFVLLKDRGLTETEIAARVGITAERVRLAIEVVKDVPKEFHQSLVNYKNNQGARSPGRVSPIVTQQLLKIRKTQSLNRAQFRALLNHAKSGMTIHEAARIAPMLADGSTVAQALKMVESARYVILEIYLDRKESERWEKKNPNTTIQSNLLSVLEKHSGFKITRRHFAAAKGWVQREGGRK